MEASEVPIKLIVFLVLGAIFVLGKLFGKKARSDGEDAEGHQRQSGGQSGEPQSPEEALERMFRQMQERRQRAQEPAGDQDAEPARQSQPPQRSQTLDDFFGQMESPPPLARPVPPVARAIPVAKPVTERQARVYREPTVRAPVAARRTVQQRVMLRKVKPAFARSEGVTLADEQRARMQEAKGRVVAAAGKDQAELLAAARGREDAGALVSLSEGNFDRNEAARAIVYLELLGAPRSLRPYSGPPAAG